VEKRAIGGLVAVFAATALILGGCGSDDAPSLSKKEFTKQANAICIESNERREAEYKVRISELETEKGFNEADREQLYLDVFIIPLLEMVGKLEDLDAPEGDEEKLDTMFEEIREGGEVLEGDPSLVWSVGSMFDKANKIGAEYGLTGCAL
jgi:hypothetical protein